MTTHRKKPEALEEWNRTAAHVSSHGPSGSDALASPRRYAPASSDPSSPTPAEGDTYFNTTLKQLMVYDGTRSKWLSDAVFTLGFAGGAGVSGYFDHHGQATDGGNGDVPVLKGTVVSVAISRSDSDASTIEVTLGGTAVCELVTSAAGVTRDSTLNADFAAGLMTTRVKSAANAIDDARVQVGYRLRA